MRERGAKARGRRWLESLGKIAHAAERQRFEPARPQPDRRGEGGKRPEHAPSRPAAVTQRQKQQFEIAGEAFGRARPRPGNQADFFLVFVASSLLTGVALAALTPWLKRRMHGRDV